MNVPSVAWANKFLYLSVHNMPILYESSDDDDDDDDDDENATTTNIRKWYIL